MEESKIRNLTAQAILKETTWVDNHSGLANTFRLVLWLAKEDIALLKLDVYSHASQISVLFSFPVEFGWFLPIDRSILPFLFHVPCHDLNFTHTRSVLCVCVCALRMIAAVAITICVLFDTSESTVPSSSFTIKEEAVLGSFDVSGVQRDIHLTILD